MFLVMVPDSLEGFERLSFIVFRLVIFVFLLYLGNVTVYWRKNDIHIPIHILYLFILDIFTKKNGEFLS